MIGNGDGVYVAVAIGCMCRPPLPLFSSAIARLKLFNATLLFFYNSTILPSVLSTANAKRDRLGSCRGRTVAEPRVRPLFGDRRVSAKRSNKS